MKKTRPTAVRKDSTKATAPNAKRTKATVNKPPTVNSKGKVKDSATTGRASARSSKPSSPARAHNDDVGQVSSTETSKTQPTAASDSGNDLGGITNGMKKIKINVITKEMKEAREREQATREGSSASATPILEEPRPSIADSDVAPTADAAHFSVPGRLLAPPSPALPYAMECQDPIPQPATPNKQDELPGQQETSMGVDPDTPVPSNPVTGTPQDDNLFIPYQPEGATPQAIAQAAPTRWLPPNTLETPAAFRGHNFTATSAIPFSPSPTKLSQRLPATGNFPPATPQQASSVGGHVATPAPTNQYNLFPGPRMDHEISTEPTDAKNSDAYMWEVPETPEHRT